MQLSELLNNTEYTCKNFKNVDIKSLCYDSRKADGDSMFVCLVGTAVDGHSYISSAYEKGCRVFAVSKDIDGFEDATFIKFSDTRIALAIISANFFNNPAKNLLVIGITGTKGKTSISFMIKSILENAGKKVGIIGTTGIIYKDTFIKSDNSTPESYEIHRHFSDMLKCGIDTVVMEVSSQGLMMHRTYGINFDAAVYTNLSPDHIGDGEHKSFEEYRYCKSLLFAQCKSAFANADDDNYKFITAPFKGKTVLYSATSKADIYAEDIHFECDDNGLKTDYTLCNESGKYPIKINIPGQFTVYNSLAAAACCLSVGAGIEDVQKGLAVAFVEGRMQKVNTGLPFTSIIDYAHNALSMDNLYGTIEKYPHKRIITVFGCGGNRAKSRRYDMGRIAAQKSDLCVITSDNSRFEKLEDIIEDIKVGIVQGQQTNPSCKIEIIKDRKEAIEFAMRYAESGDIIIIPGKGHQHYEEIEGKKIPFDEKEIIENYAKVLLSSERN